MFDRLLLPFPAAVADSITSHNTEGSLFRRPLLHRVRPKLARQAGFATRMVLLPFFFDARVK